MREQFRLSKRWLRRALARLWRSRDGATAIEMAFVLPVFLAFLLGIEEFGRAFWTESTLQYAVEAAARCAAVSPSLCTPTVEDYAASQAFGLSIPDPAKTFTYTPNATCGASSVSTGALVTASYAFQQLVPQLVPLNVTLSAKSCHP